VTPLLYASRVRERLRGRQVSPEAIAVVEAHVGRLLDDVGREAERVGARRVDATLARRVLRREGL